MNWDTICFNNPLRDWAIAFSVIIGLLVLFRIFRKLILKRLKAWTAKTASTLDDFAVHIVERAVLPLIYLAGIGVGLSYLEFTPKTERVLKIAFLVAGTFFILRLISAFIRCWRYCHCPCFTGGAGRPVQLFRDLL